MPKFRIDEYGDNQEIVFHPSENDVRYTMSGAIERYENSGWHHIGNLDMMFLEVDQLRKDRSELMSFMWDQMSKDSAELIADELEDNDDALREAGQHLRQLEKMLRIARKTYNEMVPETQAKMETFERLDTPYPD